MTPSEIDAMPAGREMDALIHEHVFGRKTLTSLHYLERPDVLGPPLYSVDIRAAMDVLVKIGEYRSKRGMHSSGYSLDFYKPVVKLEFYEHDGEIDVVVGRCKGFTEETDVHTKVWSDGGGRGHLASMALAICRTALKIILGEG